MDFVETVNNYYKDVQDAWKQFDSFLKVNIDVVVENIELLKHSGITYSVPYTAYIESCLNHNLAILINKLISQNFVELCNLDYRNYYIELIHGVQVISMPVQFDHSIWVSIPIKFIEALGSDIIEFTKSVYDAGQKEVTKYEIDLHKSVPDYSLRDVKQMLTLLLNYS